MSPIRAVLPPHGVLGVLLLALAAGGAPGPAVHTAVAATASAPSRPAAAPDAATPEPSARRRVPRPVQPDTARVQLREGGPEAFVAYPPGAGAAPGVVIVHEWWGLNAQIRELARRLARQGYVAIVPDLYGGKVATDGESAHVLARGLDEAEALETIAAAGLWLEQEPRAGRRRRAVMGFCMGGGLALRTGLRDPSLSAVVMFYGPPESRADLLASLQAPLLGHFGAEDQGISVERVEAFGRSLTGAGKTADVHVYPGAGHAFMNEEQAGYRPDAARLAWVRTLDFLQKHVKGRP